MKETNAPGNNEPDKESNQTKLLILNPEVAEGFKLCSYNYLKEFWLKKTGSRLIPSKRSFYHFHSRENPKGVSWEIFKQFADAVGLWIYEETQIAFSYSAMAKDPAKVLPRFQGPIPAIWEGIPNYKKIKPFQSVEAALRFLAPQEIPAKIKTSDVPDKRGADHQTVVRKSVRRYVETVRNRFEKARLPLPMEGNKHFIPMASVRLNLPVLVLNEHSFQIVQETHLSRYTESVRIERAIESKWGIENLETDWITEPGRRIVLIGDPGSGKTTFQCGVAFGIACKWLDDSNSPIPIMLECNTFSEKAMPSNLREIVELAIAEWVPEELDRLVCDFEAAAFDGRLALLVDGLDEIPEEELGSPKQQRIPGSRRKRICQTLVRLSALYPKLRILVTSRPYGTDAIEQELAQAFEILYIAPLRKDDKVRFLENICDAVGYEDATGAREHILELDENIASLSDNCLMLTLSVQVYWNDPLSFPKNRPQLLNAAIQQMICRRQEQQISPVTFNELVPRLEYLALRMRETNKVRILQKEAVGHFTQFCKLMSEIAPTSRSEYELLSAAIHPVGILALAGRRPDDAYMYQDELKFVHQSFQEFFAGCAIQHERSGQETLEHLRNLIDEIVIVKRSVRETYVTTQEPVVSSHFQQTIRMCIAQLSEQAVDKAFTLLRCEQDIDRNRAFAVFAMRCLADGPEVSETTLSMIFECFIGCMDSRDAVSMLSRTSWDEALKIVGASTFGNRLREYLLTAFLTAEGISRRMVGSAYMAVNFPREAKITWENATQVISELQNGLDSTEAKTRAIATFVFWERCFHTNAQLGFLAGEQANRVIDCLLTAAETDTDLRNHYLMALCWFTSAEPYILRKESRSLLSLDSKVISRILGLLKQQATTEFRFAGLLASMDKTVTCNIFGFDWIYEAAEIADGLRPRRDWLNRHPHWNPSQKGSVEIVQLLVERLRLRLDCDGDQERIAIALARFGVTDDIVVRVLGNAFTNLSDSRDEISVHLGLNGSREALQYLVATLSYSQQEDPYEARGLFGLLIADNVLLLEQVLLNANANAYCLEIAYGIAGSRFRSEGMRILRQHAKHKNPVIASVIKQAIQKRKEWDRQQHKNSPGLRPKSIANFVRSFFTKN